MPDDAVADSRVRELERELEIVRHRSGELEEFLEQAAEGLHMVGPDGTILWANEAELRMLGYTREEYIGRKIEEFHVDQEIVADFLVRLLRGETLCSRSARLRCKDGSVKLVAVSSNGMFRDGKFIHTRCFTRDVTRERQAEEAQARLAAIVESSDDAIISKTLDGTITSWNGAAERMYGYSAREAIGRSVLTIVPQELHSEERMLLDRIRAGEGIEHYQTTRLAKSGRRVDVSLTISPVRDADGRVIGASKIARDISAQVEAQRRKDQFLAILAHELRNPLAPVRSAIRIFKEPAATDEQRRRAQQIAERQTEHMARLLEDLLDVSRITTGRVELRKGRVELGLVVTQSVDAVKPQLDAKEHVLEVRPAPEPLWVEGDPVRLQQIVANLLVNAGKYTDPGGRIVVATRREGDYAVISVKDNGIGFAPEMAPRLFTLFAQAEGAANRDVGGLGIGLALVREFVERHGGTVEARSEGPLLGSEFTVRLPCEPA